jgi:diaminohydroxyphosphoribosylaminopyrimidine deaminase/5-amino-6-(5-phosphoribosylamino)uracil reductase
MKGSEIYMHRCLELAQMGRGNVAPNPMVGSVLVHNEVIIGEGYHRKYGEAHAEVNCLNSVEPEHQHLIGQSTLYVSLEPCAHFGKTPPCADLIVRKRIPKVVIGCRDPFVEVAGKGIEKLKAGGVEVELGVLEKACKDLNKRFFTFHTKHRPYVVLKWAQTGDGKMAAPSDSPDGREPSAQIPLKQDADNSIDLSEALQPGQIPPSGGGRAARLLISNEYTNRLVHKWRGDEMAIMVGTNTALSDDPELSTRLWPGKNPVRLVVDMDLRLPGSLKLMDGTIPTIVFNSKRHTIEDLKSGWQSGVHFYQVTKDVNLVHQMMNALFNMSIQSVLVEGGAYLLQSFIDEGLWDEARVITNEEMIIGNGLLAPVLNKYKKIHSESILSDKIRIYQPVHL